MRYCHGPSSNPRQEGMCVCGRPGDDRPDDSVPILERNVRWERDFVKEAGRRVGYSFVEHLEAYAEARTLPGPVKLPPGRDLAREACEELADCRNYLCWKAYEAFLQGDEPTVHRMMDSLGYMILAWQALAD